MISPQRVAEALGQHPPTEEQAAVIAAPSKPALVVAGAGAGKTETMAARVVWLVCNGIVTPERVLGLTFTRKAARQLADRVRARLRRLAGSDLLDETDPSGELRALVLASDPTVLTYHSYAGRLVSEHGLRLPVEPGARVLTETAAWQLASRVVSSWDGDLDTDKVPATITGYVLQLAGELAEHLVRADQLEEQARWLSEAILNAPRAPKQAEKIRDSTQRIVAAQQLRIALLPLIEDYQRRKRAEGAVDFADQMALAARLALDHPEVVASERQRYHAVLLDEYQDTGHAQRVLLRTLFGGASAAQEGLPVTAVGDPAQAIYGWRGASAANLPRFTEDFPTGERLSLAETYGLLTSFRNPPEVLTLANAVSGPLREAGLEVGELRARDGAEAADVVLARHETVVAEREWLADQVARRWFAHIEEQGVPPTAAVLLRRRADMADIATSLRANGVPVEVVGLGGLLHEPEVRDLVSALRVLVDPLAGTAAARLLTGARWRLGAADLAALWKRCRSLAGAAPAMESTTIAGVDVLAALPGEHAEQAGLVDAVDDPGPAEHYSKLGYARIRLLGKELSALRARMDQPLPELVADVERTMLLDIETLSRPTPIGRTQLDAFAEVVADYAATSPSASLTALLDYLAVAEDAEDGLAPGEVEVSPDRVQLLTMHAAKGLEWEIVAAPHLVDQVFPARKQSSSWLASVPELPAQLRGDSVDLPRLSVPSGGNRKEIEEALERHEDAFDVRRLTEERRLFYVALTRTERVLLLSGHWWGENTGKARKASPFLTEVHELVAADPSLGTVDRWDPPPAEDATNPLRDNTRSAMWPVDPLRQRRSAVDKAAEMVRAARSGSPVLFTTDEDPDGWARDVDVLLAERSSRRTRTEQVVLPQHLSVSQLVELAEDPGRLAAKLRRPLPFAPNPSARRGTAFHAWLEHRFGASTLLDLDELPGAADAGAAADTELESLQQAFLRGSWAEKMPHQVEVPFETEVDGVAVRGRMDAVFADTDGGWTVVDWKTGAVPDEEKLRSLAVQLAAYRLAWSAISGTDLSLVRAAFHYVRENETVRPADLLDADGLRALVREVG
jgi:DNA helicase-2/ATP-dependent DNA helicase PcrA